MEGSEPYASLATVVKMIIYGILLILASTPDSSGQSIAEVCKEESLSTRSSQSWSTLLEMVTTANSYIPRDSYWRRPQESIAPCFRVVGDMHAVAGCTKRVRMLLDKGCATALYEAAGAYPELYRVQVLAVLFKKPFHVYQIPLQ